MKLKYEVFSNETFLNHDIRQRRSNAIEKVKPGFLIPLMCMFPESNWTKG